MTSAISHLTCSTKLSACVMIHDIEIKMDVVALKMSFVVTIVDPDVESFNITLRPSPSIFLEGILSC